MAPCADDIHYRQLVENLGVAVISTDLEFRIRTWNAAAARTFGAAAERMIGTPISSIVPKERRAAAERMLRRAVQTGETIQFEFQHRDALGARRELAGTMAPVVSATGTRVGASISIRDITRRIALQSELDESRKMVALGEMAGAIAHHFNNILGGVVTSIDYAQRSDDVALKSRVLEQVGTALQRATSLVDGLLAFAEGDHRSDDLCDLTEVVTELAEEIETAVRGTPISFTLAMPQLPVIPVPRQQVRTVVGNITQNAIEAMHGKGGTLRLDLSTTLESVVILVEDTGCGLDDAAKSRIFEPFWTTKGVLGAGATGLGLAIAHGLVHMLGGTISVTSELGKGSCFRVTFPLPRQAG